jgi:cytochrome c55X
LLTAVVMLASTGTSAEPLPESRQQQLIHLLKHDCGSCHGLTMKGGLGPPLLPAAIEEKPDAAMIEAILDGRTGTPMPSWSFALSESEAAWLVQRLRSGELQ